MAKVRGTDDNDRLHGRTGDDLVKGIDGDDRLAGRAGDDILRGGGGDDLLIGAGDRDTLYGDAGNDRLYGGHGSDAVTGGSGADRFIYRSVLDAVVGDGEHIIDFEEGVDKRAFHGELGLPEASLHFIGSEPFSGVAGEVRFDVGGGGSVVHIDIDGDTRIDMVIHFDTEVHFQARDFAF